MRIQNIKLRYIFFYVGFDYLSAALSWFFFGAVQSFLNYSFLLYPDKLFGLLNTFIFVPFFWILLYILYNTYSNILRKSRFQQLYTTFQTSVVGSFLLYFILITDSAIVLRPFFQVVLLTTIHYVLTFLPRYFITRHLVKSFHSLHLQIPSLVIAESPSLPLIQQKLQQEVLNMGNKIVGYISYTAPRPSISEEAFPFLGLLQDLPHQIIKYDIQELILTQENKMNEKILEILSLITPFQYLHVKITPSSEALLLESSELESVFATPWVFITTQPLNDIQRLIKRNLDIVLSLLALFFCLPIFLVLAIWIPLNSKGSIFFRQERIGFLGRPFQILKFRTMYVHAEQAGPQLSRTGDERITSLGIFLRRTRIDEIPQLFNVLRGEMSLVGPRPERQYYIDQITQTIPYYKLLHAVRPGITSLGQIRYGYAENVQQMIERLKYDLIYIQQQSLALDFKILLYTISIVLRGKGK